MRSAMEKNRNRQCQVNTGDWADLIRVSWVTVEERQLSFLRFKRAIWMRTAHRQLRVDVRSLRKSTSFLSRQATYPEDTNAKSLRFHEALLAELVATPDRHHILEWQGAKWTDQVYGHLLRRDLPQAARGSIMNRAMMGHG